jgi:hypothetical protein
MGFILLLGDESVKGCGNGEDEDRARARAARAEVASAERSVKGMQRRQCLHKRTSSGLGFMVPSSAVGDKGCGSE